MTSKSKSQILFISLIIIISVIPYLNSLTGEFIWDDTNLIIENPYIKNWSIFHKNLTNDFFFGSSATEEKIGYYRPVVTLTYAIDYSLWRLKPYGYHITNLLFHALCGIIIYLLLLSLLKSHSLSLIVALLFAVHPIHSESVTWISGRTDVVCGVLFFFALYCYHIWSEKNYKTIYFLSLFSFTLSLLSKEMAITLPLILILYDFYFNTNQKWNNLFKRKKYWLPFWGVILVYLGVRFFILQLKTTNTYLASIGKVKIIITFLKAFTHYLYKLIMPFYLTGYIQMDVSSSVLEPQIILALVILIGLATIVYKTSATHKATCFGIIFFFITLLPISNIIPISGPEDMGFMMAERFLYIPSFGFCLLLGILFDRIFVLSHQKTFYKILSGFSLIFILLFYCTITIFRNMDWQKERLFFLKTLETSPNAVLLQVNFGKVCLNQKKYDLALSVLKEALKLNPNSVVAHYNLGIAYLKKGIYDEAINSFNQALKLKPDYARAHLGLGVIYFENGLYDKAVTQFSQAIALDPDFADSYSNLGAAYFRQGLYDKAIAQFANALMLNPDNAEAHSNLGAAYFKQELYDKAVAQQAMAVAIRPDYIDARYNLAMAYRLSGKYKEAIEELNRIIKLNPNHGPAYYTMGTIYADDLMDSKKSLEYLNIALPLFSGHPKMDEIRQKVNQIQSNKDID